MSDNGHTTTTDIGIDAFVESMYRGVRAARGKEKVTVQAAEGKLEELPVRYDRIKHARGFSWGYGGSSPAQLAWALLAHHFKVLSQPLPEGSPFAEDFGTKGDAIAWFLHHPFKDAFLAGIDEDRWFATSADVRLVVEEILASAETPALLIRVREALGYVPESLAEPLGLARAMVRPQGPS